MVLLQKTTLCQMMEFWCSAYLHLYVIYVIDSDHIQSSNFSLRQTKISFANLLGALLTTVKEIVRSVTLQVGIVLNISRLIMS